MTEQELLNKLSSFLSMRRPIEIETLILEDDDSPVGTEAYESDTPPVLKDGQDLTLKSSKTIGGPSAPKNPPTYIKPKHVIDNRAEEGEDDSVMVWSKAKNCYIKRKRT